jgi:hypothetical protein
MGKWLDQLREYRKSAETGTDRTDKTNGGGVFVGFVSSQSEPFVNFRPSYDGAGWDEEDWQVAFSERAAIVVEFDQDLPRKEAEALALRQIETERKGGCNEYQWLAGEEASCDGRRLTRLRKR